MLFQVICYFSGNVIHLNNKGLCHFVNYYYYFVFMLFVRKQACQSGLFMEYQNTLSQRILGNYQLFVPLTTGADFPFKQKIKKQNKMQKFSICIKCSWVHTCRNPGIYWEQEKVGQAVLVVPNSDDWTEKKDVQYEKIISVTPQENCWMKTISLISTGLINTVSDV